MKKTENKAPKKKTGVMAVYVSILKKAGEKGLSKAEWLKRVTKAFPDREPAKMASTLSAIVSRKDHQEKYKVVRIEKGVYRVAE